MEEELIYKDDGTRIFGIIFLIFGFILSICGLIIIRNPVIYSQDHLQEWLMGGSGLLMGIISIIISVFIIDSPNSLLLTSNRLILKPTFRKIEEIKLSNIRYVEVYDADTGSRISNYNMAIIKHDKTVSFISLFGLDRKRLQCELIKLKIKVL